MENTEGLTPKTVATLCLSLAVTLDQGHLRWQGRPAIIQIAPGQRVRLLKVSENSWLVESLDGDLPVFT